MSETWTKTDSRTMQGDDEPAPVPLLTLAHHEEPTWIGRRLVLRGKKILGRGSDLFADGACDDARLSRRHLEISTRGDAVTVTDLGSRNGSFVNGEPLHGSQRLEDGDVVGAGGMLLLFHHGAPYVRRAKNSTLVGVSQAMATIDAQIEAVAERDVTVLIQGESGVGKELVARALHEHSEKRGAFVALNCGAVADGLLNSELFGHRKGAFSGADADREGLVTSAAGGTLFLDEIGDASPAFQTSLLRLLEQREYRAVGSNHTLTTDARFVAATHVDLLGADSGFRKDLVGRLARWVIFVPPLRERREDIVVLALALARRVRGSEVELSRSLALALLRYDWPLNVRELSSVVEQAVVESGDDPVLGLSRSLSDRLQPKRQSLPPPGRDGSTSATSESRMAKPRAASRPSRDQLIELFREHRGNMRAVARALGIGRSTLYRWLEAADLDVDSLRAKL